MSTNPLNYTQYDFDLLVSQLQERLSASDAWKDIYRSSTGSMLIEFLAYVTNMVMYNIERRAQETYIDTAQNLSSVKALVSLLKYEPKRKTSSVGNLKFTISSSLTKIVIIPKYTECTSVDNVKYLTNEESAIQKGQTEITVEGIQGTYATKEITSDGSLNQEYLLSNTSIENSASSTNPTLRVVVDGTEWTKVSSFLNSTNTSKHYRVINELDDTVSILFGDNINGAAPASGNVVSIRYVISDGAEGNAASTGKITTLNDTIYDEDGNTVSSISVTNTSSFLGGDDQEDIEEIRVEAPQVFKTGDRAVTKEDFVTIIKNQAGVADANVWGENEEAEAAGVDAVQSMLNLVKMAIILQEWELPDSTFKDNLADTIYNISMLTVKYEFVDPVILYTIPTLTVKVVSGESISGTQTAIESALASQFLLGSTTKLGTLIKYSQILSTIHGLSGVAYANMVLKIRKELSDTYTSLANWGATLEALSVKPETVQVYINNTLVTTDTDDGDGTGSFSASGSYTISGDVNYSTGVLTLDISPTPSSVHVRYQQDQEGNIVPTFNQIAKLYSVDITSITSEAS
jgi:hypothetical protein